MGQILCLAYIISFNSRTAIKINVMFPFYIWGNWGSEKVNTIWTWHYTCNPLQDMASARARGKTFLSLLPRAPHVILTWQTPLTRSALSFPHPEGSEPSFMDVKMCLLRRVLGLRAFASLRSAAECAPAHCKCQDSEGDRAVHERGKQCALHRGSTFQSVRLESGCRC